MSRLELIVRDSEFSTSHKRLKVNLDVVGDLYLRLEQEFSAKVDSSELDSIISNLEENNISYKKFNGKHSIIKAKVMVDERDRLPIQFSETTPHFTQYQKWYNFMFGDFVTLDSSFADQVLKVRELEKEFQIIYDSLPGTKSIKTRTFNQFMKFNYGDESLEKNLINFSQKYGFEHLDNFSLVHNNLNELRNNFSQTIDFNLKVTDFGRRAILDVNIDDPSFLEKSRDMNYDDLEKSKWCFLDIEIPLFKDEKRSAISWIGVNYWQNGIVDKRIYSLHETLDTFDGARMITCSSEKELLTLVVDDINLEDPLFLSAYNAKFDFLKIKDSLSDEVSKKEIKKEMKKLDIKKDVHINFFERIVAPGRQVMDLYTWAKTMFPYLPNSKLNCVSKEFVSFDKIIDYDELRQLEEISLDGKTSDELLPSIKGMIEERVGPYMSLSDSLRRKAAATVAAEYLADDVDVMPQMLFGNDLGRGSLQDLVELRSLFRTDLYRLMHSPTSLDNFVQKMFFEKMLIHRSDLFKVNENSIKFDKKLRLKSKDFLDKVTKTKSKPGIYNDVSVAYLPLENLIFDFFKGFNIGNFEWQNTLSDFKEYSDSVSDSSRRSFFLSKFTREIGMGTLKQVASYVIKDQKLDRMIKDYSVDFDTFTSWNSILFGDGDKTKRFEKLSKLTEFRTLIDGEIAQFCSDIGQSVYSSFKKISLSKARDADKKLKSLAKKVGFSENRARTYTKDNNESDMRFLGERLTFEMFNIYNKMIDIDIRLNAQRGFPIDVFFDELNYQRNDFFDHVDTLDLNLINGINGLVFFEGEIPKDSPFYVVDHIDSVLVGESKNFFKKNGYYSGFNFKNHASHNFTLHETTYLRHALDIALTGDLNSAKKIAKEGYDLISSVPSENHYFFYKTKKINDQELTDVNTAFAIVGYSYDKKTKSYDENKPIIKEVIIKSDVNLAYEKYEKRYNQKYKEMFIEELR